MPKTLCPIVLFDPEIERTARRLEKQKRQQEKKKEKSVERVQWTKSLLKQWLKNKKEIKHQSNNKGC